MNKKNNKGITMISLIIIVIIMILLASITVYEANELVAITRVQSVTTNLLLIQAQVRIINEKVVFENDEDKKADYYMGSKLSSNNEMLNSLKSKGIITSDEDKYYILGNEDFNKIGLDIDASNDYVVNYETEEVIYVKGVKDENGNYLYKLSDMNVEI